MARRKADPAPEQPPAPSSLTPAPYQWVPEDEEWSRGSKRLLHSEPVQGPIHHEVARRGPRRIIAIAILVVLLGTGATVIVSLNAGGPNHAVSTPTATNRGLITDRMPGTSTTTSTTAPTEAVGLRGRPLSPVDIDPVLCASALHAGAFAPSDVPAWRVGNDAAPPAMSEDDIRAEISRIMRRRFRGDQPDRAVAEALAIYDAPVIREATRDDPTLRAAIAELKGTLGEPAIDLLLSRDRAVSVVFGVPISDRSGAETTIDGDLIQILLREEFRHERPALVAPIIFHELLHRDGEVQFDEELIANVLDMRVTIEQLRDDPEALALSTPLAKNMRWRVLAQLNDRVGAELAAVRSDASVLLPNTQGTSNHTLEDFIRNVDPAGSYQALTRTPTPGHRTLTAVLRAMDPAAAPADAAFDDVAIAFIDTHAGLGPCDQLVVGSVLGVVPPGPAARAATGWLSRLPL